MSKLDLSFREPVELQEWYDIGADIRIAIRLQFSKLQREANAELTKATELIGKLEAVISNIAEEKDMFPNRHGLTRHERLIFYARESLKEISKWRSGE